MFDLDHVDTWVFDLDNTLYPAEINLFDQVDQRMSEFIAQELDLSFEDGKVKISVNFHEPFRWEKTRYESIKKFPQPWIGSPDTPHEIWFEEKGVMEWLQTDMMFMDNYKVIGDSAKYVLDRYTEKYGGIGIKTWSINDDGNLKSFDETTAKDEIYTPEAFAKKFGLEFHQSDKYEIEAEVLGYGVSLILLNVGMYVGIPAVVIVGIRKRF